MKSRAKRIKETRLNGFIKLPKKLALLITEGYISHSAFSLYLLLLSIAVYSENSDRYGAVDLNVSKLSKLHGKSSSQTYRYFNELSSLGLVHRIDDQLIGINDFNKVFGDVSNMEENTANLISKVAKKKGELSLKKN